jgi:hypothetical protein
VWRVRRGVLGQGIAEGRTGKNKQERGKYFAVKIAETSNSAREEVRQI